MTYQNLDDESLVRLAQREDRAALEALLQRVQPQVYRFGKRMCRDPDDAEDILQETLLAMARGIGEFRGSSSLSTWLYSVARSFCIKKRRTSKYAPERIESLDEGDAVAEVHDAAPSPEEAASRAQTWSEIERAIAELAPDYREVLVLRDLDGLRAREVSEVMGLSVAAVKSRLHRARADLRRRLSGRAAPTACPDVATMLSKHLEGELSPDTCAEMERHIEGCAPCAASCDALRSTLTMCRAAPPDEVPKEVQRRVRDALREHLSRAD